VGKLTAFEPRWVRTVRYLNPTAEEVVQNKVERRVQSIEGQLPQQGRRPAISDSFRPAASNCSPIRIP